MKLSKYVWMLILAMFIFGFSFASLAAYTNVVPEDALKMLLENPDVVVIDVSPAYANGHLPRTVNYPLGDALDKAVTMLDLTGTYLVYCQVTQNAITGAQKLVDAGFDKVYLLEGNYNGWVEEGYPVEK